MDHVIDLRDDYIKLGQALKAAGLVLQDVYMSGITESFDSDTYITQMRFTCVVVDDPTPQQTTSN